MIPDQMAAEGQREPRGCGPSPSTNGLAVELRNVGYCLGKRQIVSGVSFKVAPGETLVLLGRSGTGKTTTLKLDQPAAGILFGRNLCRRPPASRLGSHSPAQADRLCHPGRGAFPALDRGAECGHGAPAGSLAGDARRASASGKCWNWWASTWPNSPRANPSELSGGQRQRVGVARALAADPPILLMDEPFGALDPVTRAELQREFCELAKRLEKAIIFVTHDLREALLIGTHIGLFTEGRLARHLRARGVFRFQRSRKPGRLSIRSAPARSWEQKLAADHEHKEEGVSFLTFLVNYRGEIFSRTLEHLLLVAAAMLAAVLIGIPLGIALVRRHNLRRWVLGTANVIQTIPSLALFGFLIPVPFLGGIGARTAIVALALYALLPILRNTYTGIAGVDPAVLESARGMGMTPGTDSLGCAAPALHCRDSRRSARGHDHLHRRCHDCGRHRRGRAGRLYFSRRGHGQQFRDSGRGNSRGVAGDCRGSVIFGLGGGKTHA